MAKKKRTPSKKQESKQPTSKKKDSKKLVSNTKNKSKAPPPPPTTTKRSCFQKITSCTCYIIQILVILFLMLFSGIPSQLGLFRFLAKMNPASVGLTPAFNVGIKDGYTFEQLDQLDLSGQTALITGGNSGVGFETAKYLFKLGADVTIICRSKERCVQAASTINNEQQQRQSDTTTTTNNNNRKKHGKITTLIADMSDLRSTHDATIKYAESNNSTLDMLFLNAGIASAGKNEDGGLKLSVDGIEKVFATNHVGHHLMWKILESKVKSSNCGRVVLTSSASNFGSYDYGIATDLETLNAGEANMKAYGQSKLAQVLWAQELTRRLGPDSNVYVNSYHPGAAATMIWFTNPMIPLAAHPILRFFTENVMWTSLEGALTMLYLGAASEDLVTNNVRGKYFHPQVQEVIPNPKFAQNLQLQKDLWTFSDELIERA